MTERTVQTSKEVSEALRASRPVLALESTIITHGMPYPKNLETALSVQRVVREEGAVPACCAILDGRLKAGLSDEEIERLAILGQDAQKASRRDIPALVQRRETGATTVAGTMIIAAMAGIRVFATGGIGGVHRGAGQSMDISADLQELARTNVAVVCAGAKSILDIGLTLEYLETQGVPVLGVNTDAMPAFYCRDSGYGVDYRMDSAADIAEVLSTKWSLGIDGGVVIVNPIPESYALDAGTIDSAVGQAIDEAQGQGVTGKDLTPFLLARIETLTGGDSLEANIQLMLNNARVGAQIAAALCS